MRPFLPIFLQDVSSAFGGTTINVDMLIRARAVSGETLKYRTGSALSFDSCI